MFGNMIENLSEQVNNNMPESNDYTSSDGLLYCGKCHTPKQVRINFLGEEKTPFCLCKCAQAAFEKFDRKCEQTLKQQRIERNRETAFPDDRANNGAEAMRNWTFDRDSGENPEITNAAKIYTDNFSEYRKTGSGLLFYGDNGRGKSVMAACIANALLDKGYTVLFTTFSRIVNTIQGMREGKQYYLDSLNNYDLLILDDFGAERDTSYMREIIFNVIDSRKRSGLPLILTSNLSDSDLKNPNPEDKRIISRVVAMCEPIYFTGKDLRRENAVRNYAEMRRKLGI